MDFLHYAKGHLTCSVKLLDNADAVEDGPALTRSHPHISRANLLEDDHLTEIAHSPRPMYSTSHPGYRCHLPGQVRSR